MKGLSRDEAMTLLHHYITNENLVRHMVAAEAILRDLAPRFQQDPDLWGITGLLHDIDLECIDNDMQRHARHAVDAILRPAGFPQEGLDAILAHNGDNLGIPMSSTLDYALSCSETITGLIVACTLVYPSKQVADVQVKSILKRMKETRFAATVNRDSILLCEAIGIPLAEFVELSLRSMTRVAPDIGLGGTV